MPEKMEVCMVDGWLISEGLDCDTDHSCKSSVNFSSSLAVERLSDDDDATEGHLILMVL